MFSKIAFWPGPRPRSAAEACLDLNLFMHSYHDRLILTGEPPEIHPATRAFARQIHREFPYALRGEKEPHLATDRSRDRLYGPVLYTSPSSSYTMAREDILAAAEEHGLVALDMDHHQLLTAADTSADDEARPDMDRVMHQLISRLRILPESIRIDRFRSYEFGRGLDDDPSDVSGYPCHAPQLARALLGRAPDWIDHHFDQQRDPDPGSAGGFEIIEEYTSQELPR